MAYVSFYKGTLDEQSISDSLPEGGIYFQTSTRQIYMLNSEGSLVTFNGHDNNTKNTAGSTDTSSKIYLIGATSQATNPQTYSHDTVYVGTDGALYTPGVVSTTTAYKPITTNDRWKQCTYTSISSIPAAAQWCIVNVSITPRLVTKGSSTNTSTYSTRHLMRRSSSTSYKDSGIGWIGVQMSPILAGTYDNMYAWATISYYTSVKSDSGLRTGWYVDARWIKFSGSSSATASHGGSTIDSLTSNFSTDFSYSIYAYCY